MEGTTGPDEKSGVGSDACQPQPSWKRRKHKNDIVVSFLACISKMM
jgi:hypothetical protein